jgi:hypothetical protein
MILDGLSATRKLARNGLRGTLDWINNLVAVHFPQADFWITRLAPLGISRKSVRTLPKGHYEEEPGKRTALPS